MRKPMMIAWTAAWAALIAPTAASLAWTPSPAAGRAALVRGLAYAAIAGAGLAARRRVSARDMAAGLLCVIAGACIAALVWHLMPATFPVLGTAWDAGRLSAPLGYWNATGAFAAMGIVLGLGFTIDGPRASRMLAAGCLPPLALVLYLTYSRGAIGALAIGLAAMLLLERRRGRLVGYALAVAPACLGVAALAHASRAITTGAYGPAAAGAGLRLLAATVALAAASAAAVAASGRLRPRGAVAGAVVATLALAAAGAALLGGHGDVNRTDARLGHLSLNGRGALWRVAWDDFRAHPGFGSGAGSFQAEFAAAEPVTFTPVYSHSLELGTLAELGAPGGLAIAVILLLPGAAAVRARRAPGTASILGAYAVFCAHSAVDWDWQVPGVTAAAMLCAVALLSLADPPKSPPARVVN